MTTISKTGSLFSGIGGIELGLEICGIKNVVWQAESNEFAQKILKKHWPTVKLYSDVKEIDNKAEHPDLICGGFPCNDISSAGKKAGITGPQSNLWNEFARIINELKPSFVFIENVSDLVKRGLDKILYDLAKLRYISTWNCYGACEVGAPFVRKRMFLLARADTQEQPVISEHAEVEIMQAIAEYRGNWRNIESKLCRSVDGIPVELDAVKALGNAAIPTQVAYAFVDLHRELFKWQK